METKKVKAPVKKDQRKLEETKKMVEKMQNQLQINTYLEILTFIKDPKTTKEDVEKKAEKTYWELVRKLGK